MNKKDFGAGLRLSAENVDDHSAGPPQHEGLSQTERMWQVGSTLLSGILAINASQWIGAPLKLINPEYYDAYMAFTKQSFAVLTTTMTQWWSPTIVRVSGDASMHGQLQQLENGSLQCNFPDRLVMMANHQLYSDWLYLWWIAYTNGMHGRIHIIMKESLKKIPFIGWGAQFYNFIFVARKWEQDKMRFEQHLEKLNKPNYPMWLIIFPEGTNLSAPTRETSKQWAEKNSLEDMKHQLLPRSTGLRFCLQNLRKTTPWLYDCTIGYEGIPPGMFGQDVFTLRSSFFEGRPPKSVNMHWRRFRIADIPIDDAPAFAVWLRNRWREKDYMLEYFTRTGRFPTDHNWMLKQTHQRVNGDHAHGKIKLEHARYIETQVQSKSWEEFLLIFAPIGAFVIVLFLFYSASQAGEKNNPLNDVPEEWRDVMGQASKLLNSMSRLSDAQNDTTVSGGGVAAKVNQQNGGLSSGQNLQSKISSSSTDTSSQTGAKVKYRFVPNENAKLPKHTSPSIPKGGSATLQSQIRPFDRTATPRDDMTQSKRVNQKKRVGSTGDTVGVVRSGPSVKLKVDANQVTPKSPRQAANGRGSRATIKPLNCAFSTRSQDVKKVNPSRVAHNHKERQPTTLTSEGSALPAGMPAKRAASKAHGQIIAVKQKAVRTNKLALQGARDLEPTKASKPEPADLNGKRQLANGLWVSAPSRKSKPSLSANASTPRQLANGLWVRS